MTEALIDAEAWDTIKSMTDSAFLSELIDVFLNDTPELIQQMHSGLAAGDIELVRRAAHSLKSNSASFGATRLTEVSRRLEMTAKDGSLDGGVLQLAAVEAEYAQLVPVLVERKNEH